MCYRTNIIILHVNDFAKSPRTLNNLFSFKKYLQNIDKSYIYIVLVNIIKHYVKYSLSGLKQ